MFKKLVAMILSFVMVTSMAVNGVFAISYNDIEQTASKIDVNQIYTDQTNSADDIRCYYFDAPSAGYFTVSFLVDTVNDIGDGWQLSVLKKDSIHDIWDRTYIQGNIDTYNFGVSGGDRYYIMVSNTNYDDDPVQDPYDLKVNFTPSNDWESEYNDDFNSANTINTDDNSNGSIYGNLYTDNDVDFYKFTIKQKKYFQVNFNSTDGTGEWNVTIYDHMKKKIDEMDYVTANTTKPFLADAGDYYVRVTYGSEGQDYYLSVSTTPYAGAKNTKAPAAPAVSNAPATPAAPTVKAKVKKPAAAVISSAKNIKGKKIKVVWKKAKNAKNYQVSYRKTGAKKWSSKNTKKTSYTISRLNKKKKYQIRVRGINGKAIGKWSKTKTVKVTK